MSTLNDESWRAAPDGTTNALQFPRSFQYFSFLLRKSPVLWPLAEISAVFSYIQIVFIPLLPMYMVGINSDNPSQNVPGDVFSIFLGFSKITSSTESHFFTILPLWILIVATLVFTLISFIEFKKNISLPRSITYIRGFLFILTPTFYVLPLAVNISNDVKLLIDNSSVSLITAIHFSVSLIILIAFVIFVYWAMPLYLPPAQIFNQHLSTCLIPSNRMFNDLMLYVSLIFMSIVSRAYEFYLLTPVFILHGIWRVYTTWNYPVTLAPEAAFNLALYFHFIFNPILIFLYRTIPSFKEAISPTYVFVMIISVWIICLISSLIACYLRARRMAARLQNKPYTCSNSNDARYLCQTAITTLQVDVDTINLIEKVFDEEPTIDNLFALAVTQMSYNPTISALSTEILTLASARNISRPYQFAIYEYYKMFSQNNRNLCFLSGIDEIDSRIRTYNSMSGLFWSLMLRGDVVTALRLLDKMGQFLTQLCYDYHQLEVFFPTHSKIHALYEEFFSRFDRGEDNKMYELTRFTSGSGPFRFEKTDSTPSVSSSASSVVQEEAARAYQMKSVTENVKRLVRKPIPIYYVIGGILIIAAAAVAACLNIYEAFNISSMMDMPHMIPEFLNTTAFLVSKYQLMMYTLTHYKNCSAIANMSVGEIAKQLKIPSEPEFIVPRNIMSDISNYSRYMQLDLACVEQGATVFQDDTYLKNVRDKWASQEVPVGDSGMMMSVDQLLSSLLGNIHVFYESEGAGECPNNPLIEKMHKFWHYAFDIKPLIENNIVGSLEFFKPYFEALLDNYKSQNEFMGYIAYALYAVVWIGATVMFVEMHRFLYKTAVDHFRPSEHPTNPDERLSSTVRPFRCPSRVPIFSILLLLVFILNALSNYGLLQHQTVLIGEVFDCSQTISNAINLSLQTGIITKTTARMLLTDNMSMKDEVSNMTNRQTESVLSFLDSLSPLRFEKNHASYYSSIFHREQCDVSVNSSFMGRSSCWTNDHVFDITAIFFRRALDVNSVDEDYYIKMQYMYMNRYTSDILEAASTFASLTEIIMTEINFFTTIQFIALFVFVIIVLIFVYYMIVTYRDVETQLGNTFAALPPQYIVRYSCLVSYAADLTEVESAPNEQSPFFQILEGSDIALLVLSNQLTILAFTRGVQKIFGYKASQLIGQHIETLIPTSSKDMKSTDSKFYNQIAMMQRRETAPKFSRSLVGRFSDNSSVNIKVSVSMTTGENGDYFIVEFKPIGRELHYEDLYIHNNELIRKYQRASMPTELFRESFYSTSADHHQPIVQSFSQYAYLYIGATCDESFANSLQGPESFQPLRDILAFSVPWYSGENGSIIMDSTCDYAIALFVNNGDDDAHLRNALSFAFEFSSNNEFPTHGVVIDGDSIDVIMFPMPEPTDDEELRERRPSMTVEPLGDATSRLISVMPYLVENSLIITDNALELLADVPSQKFENSLGMDLSIIQIKVQQDDMGEEEM